jgi:hypothetical protein
MYDSFFIINGISRQLMPGYKAGDDRAFAVIITDSDLLESIQEMADDLENRATDLMYDINNLADKIELLNYDTSIEIDRDSYERKLSDLGVDLNDVAMESESDAVRFHPDGWDDEKIAESAAMRNVILWKNGIYTEVYTLHPQDIDGSMMAPSTQKIKESILDKVHDEHKPVEIIIGSRVDAVLASTLINDEVAA